MEAPPSQMSNAVAGYLVLENLTKKYDEFTAVADMSLSVPEGELIALLGPSGCGKTTTLRMVAGLVSPNEGRILVDEPLSNLDANLRDEMRDGIRSIQKDIGMTTFVTHDQVEALTMSDRVVMNEGAIEQTGTPEQIYDRPATRFVANTIGRANLFPAAVEDSDPPGVCWWHDH